MLSFRPCIANQSAEGSPKDFLAVGQLIDDAMQPGNFLLSAEVALTWTAARSETIRWEVFRGRLLDPAHTRLERTFLSWHVAEQDEPLLSVKLDIHARCIYVTRSLLCHVWEGYDTGSGIIDSRQTVKWTRELVGTLYLDQFECLDHVRDELICLIWQAVVGTSRLPLTSVEAPLPAFVLGQMYYLYRSDAGEQAITSWEEGLRQGLRTPLAWRELVKLVEFALRRCSAADLARFAEVFASESPQLGSSLPRLLRSLFNDVSLSPYTRFVENTLAWLIELRHVQLLSLLEYIEFLSHLLRQLGRHLTAYDLITFHHRGANYPDALLLDAVLKAYLQAIEEQPSLFGGEDGQLRRRALRQACLLRQRYEGHMVPDAPTSPGENARVMPVEHPRVPEEQLTQLHRRRRHLFADQPLTNLLGPASRAILSQSLLDLNKLAEQIELGLGVFIDRPLGYAKATAEPDQTPLLAHEAFSASLAHKRWQELERLGNDLLVPAMKVHADGLPHAVLADSPRPVAALADVRLVANDFVILRTLPGGLAELWKLFDWRPLQERFRLDFLARQEVRWFVQALIEQQQPVLTVFDGIGRRRLEMLVDGSQGYVFRAGVELPRAGLHVIRAWSDTDDPMRLERHELDDCWVSHRN